MRRLALIVLAAVALPSVGAAQTYGQPYYGSPPTTYGQPYGGPVGYGYGAYQSYAYGGGYGSGYGNPYAYRPPVQYGHGYGYDRGGRYGYSHRSDQWTRWSSPPGRGYHDVHGYNDDRAPRGADHGWRRDDGCYCGVGAYLYDR